MVLASWGGYCLLVVDTYRRVLDLVVAKVLERIVEVFGLGLGVW